MAQTTRTEWDLILKLDGVEYRCVNHSATFALNRIPLASCTIAVGRHVKTLEQAKIHTTAEGLTVMKEAQVILRPNKQWATWQNLVGDGPADRGLWTAAGEHVVFRGYLTGIGYRKARGSLQVSLQLIHWLSDLAFSSIFSNESHPENPSKYTFQATYPQDIAAAGAAGNRPDFIGATQFKQYITQEAVQTDLWQAIANVLCDIGKRDLIRLGSSANCGGEGGPNSEALAALARMEGAHDCAENDNKWHVPLALAGPAMDGLVAKAIRRYIGQQSLNSWWSTTIWDKLIHDFAPAFDFHIVPRVETAVVTPFVPGLRDTYRVTLEPEDIGEIGLTSYIRRPLRGVGIYAGRENRTVPSDRKKKDLTKIMGIGGCWMPEPNAKGMVLFKRCPFWLTNVPALGTRASRTLHGQPPGGGGKQPTSSALTPINGELAGDDRGKTATENAEESRGLYDRLAHYMYVQEILRGREGTITGKLRYDIAPGSNVIFHTTAGIHQPGDQLRNDFVASVMRVSCAIDAEQRRAGTTFGLAHHRTLAENAEDRTSVDSHPLYEGKKFLGAPLVDEYLFD